MGVHGVGRGWRQVQLPHLPPHIPRNKLDRGLHFRHHPLGLRDLLQAGLTEAFVLRHLQGLEYEDVAVITTVPADTVRVRAYRAREMLRGSLAPNVDTFWREKAAKEKGKGKKEQTT